jgi:hypothetical protein
MHKNVAVACPPERRRRVYAAAAARLQKIASAHPKIRFHADTPAVILATEGVNDALISFMEGTCGHEVVRRAFDCYEQALIEASEHSFNIGGKQKSAGHKEE